MNKEPARTLIENMEFTMARYDYTHIFIVFANNEKIIKLKPDEIGNIGYTNTDPDTIIVKSNNNIYFIPINDLNYIKFGGLE